MSFRIGRSNGVLSFVALTIVSQKVLAASIVHQASGPWFDHVRSSGRHFKKTLKAIDAAAGVRVRNHIHRPAGRNGPLLHRLDTSWQSAAMLNGITAALPLSRWRKSRLNLGPWNNLVSKKIYFQSCFFVGLPYRFGRPTAETVCSRHAYGNDLQRNAGGVDDAERVFADGARSIACLRMAVSGRTARRRHRNARD
jgi:hypothetical protein